MKLQKLEKKRLEYVEKARACTTLDEWELYNQQVEHYKRQIAKYESLK